MFKFKKLTAIALVAVAAMGLLAGCGSEKSKMTQEAVNKALKELKEDGTYQKIYDKWFGDYNKK